MDTRTIIQEVQGLLQGINFPASKQDVVNHAQQHGASEETAQSLQQLPDQKFGSMEELLKKLPIGGGLLGSL